MTKLTAELAFERYRDFYDHDALVQGQWHGGGDDGDGDGDRDLACGLGALDPSINSPSDCPSAVMPRWLAQMVPWLFDEQDFPDAKDWGLRFYAELKRLGGAVPFSVVHDWQANVVAPLGFEWRELTKVSTDSAKALQALHVRALAGDIAPIPEWFEALQPTLRQSYANADASAYAHAYSRADADAYADVDADPYSDADAYAYANAKEIRRQQAIKRLADGMVECLARAQP